MFFEQLLQELQQSGMEQVPIAQQGFLGFVKRESDGSSYVIFVNLPTQLPENIWSIRYSTQMVKSELHAPGEVRFLFVYLTDSSENLRELCSDDIDSHWIIDRKEARLIIYENQNDNYCGLKKLIEDVLTGKSESKKITSYVTLGIIGVNVLVYIIMYLFCNSNMREYLIDSGGLYWPSVIYKHQYYRFLTSIFIHAGINHLFNNMILLYFVGSYVEEYIGHVKFGVLYFATGILAGAVSMGYNILNEKLILSIGASGAIFGIVGALACFIVVSRKMVRDITGPRMLLFIALSILSGMQSQGVDNMAHIGGLVTGILLAVPIAWMKRQKEKKV